jgi:alkylated DNA repair dioxygenase AlkB
MTQGALFPEARVDSQNEMPGGFRYEQGFITEQEESDLTAYIGAIELKPFEFHGHIGNRRVKSFGFRYDYSRCAVETAEELPSFLISLRTRVADFAGLDVEEFRQCGINQYPAGAGIGWHKDKPQFGVVIGISLLAPAMLRLRQEEEGRWIRRSQLLMPRSIYVLTEEARAVWEHSIPPVDDLRYSIMFRTLTDKFRHSRDVL